MTNPPLSYPFPVSTMAASTTLPHLPFFFFLLLLLVSSVQTEARVSKFFSKFVNTDREVVVNLPPAPEISPSLAPTIAPAPFFDESQNAYGLYGRDSDAGETINPSLTDVEEEILAGDGEDMTDLHHDNNENPGRYEQYQNNNYQNNNRYGNSEYENNNNEYRSSEYEESDNVGNYQYQNNFEDDGYRRSRHNPTRQQGMSDTRFMENGRYYHDVNSRTGEEKASYESKKYPYEFDSMEEYEKNEGLLP